MSRLRNNNTTNIMSRDECLDIRTEGVDSLGHLEAPPELHRSARNIHLRPVERLLVGYLRLVRISSGALNMHLL